MRFIKTLYQTLRITGLFLVCFFLSAQLFAQEKKAKKVKPVEISISVTDDQGNTLPKASVVVGEGIIHAETDQNGELKVQAKPDDFITVSKTGYEKEVKLASQIIENASVQLIKSKIYMTSDDDVALPFMSVKKRHATGSSTVLSSAQLDKYPSSDFRNALTGLASNVNVNELQGAPGLSAEENLNKFRVNEKIEIYSRGRKMVFIIDDVPTDITEMPLDPNEIESVTIMKDIVSKSMFGPAAADGVIFIKTKRGKQNERILKVDVESGVNMVDRMPEMVGGADYARLNNMARINSGLEPLYSETDIAAYENGDPYNMYHPNVNYSDMMLKNTALFSRANVSSQGGNDRVQYFAYLGYNGEGDIYKIGPKADYNRLNTRSNIDIKVNDFIKVQFDFFGGLTFRRSPNYGYDDQFTSEGSDNPALDIMEFGSAINDITRTPPIEFPVYANNDPELKAPWYAVSSRYSQNPIGNLEDNGYYTETGRTGMFNVALDYDASQFVDGLTSKTFFGFNAFNLTRIGKAENYIAYIVNPTVTETGEDTITLNHVHDGVDQSGQSKLHDYYFQRYVVYQNLSYEKAFGKNYVQASGTFYQSKLTRNGFEEPQRARTYILTALYSFDDKYNLQAVMNYHGGSSFSPEERYVFSPTVGASWVMSEENFMSDVKWIDFLKLRAEAGILGYESFLSPYYYRDRWNNNSSGSQFGPHQSNQWFGGATDNQVYRTTPSRIGNPDLSWEKRKEFNAGIDAVLFNHKLEFELNYYNQLRDGAIGRVYNTIPYVAGISSWLPRLNYNKIRYSGFETTLQFTDKKGDFTYSFGGNAALTDSKYEQYDEPNYRFDYQSRIGQPVDAIRGQTYLGKFTSDEEANAIPQLFDEQLSAGDLKYMDKNGDGVVDDNDESMIGRSDPRLYYSLNIKLNYKNVELYVMGTGGAFHDILLNTQYYRNGWGDNNYSAFVRDNIGGAYPKLTYYRVNNNFVTSDFWLAKAGYFKIQNAELAWNVPTNNLQFMGIRKIRLFARGANLFTFSKIKDIDPESKNSGQGATGSGNDADDRGLYPLFTTITGGLKLTF